MASNDIAAPKPATGGGLWRKLALLVVVAVVVGVAFLQFGDVLTLANLAQQESQLRSFQQQHPVLVYGIAFLIYVVVTGLSLPGAAVLTLAYGWYFGILRGVIVVSFASTSGATLAFLLSRYLFRDAIDALFEVALQNMVGVDALRGGSGNSSKNERGCGNKASAGLLCRLAAASRYSFPPYSTQSLLRSSFPCRHSPVNQQWQGNGGRGMLHRSGGYL